MTAILAGTLTPIERAQHDFNHIFEYGTPAQKEAVLIVLSLVAMLKPGPHCADSVGHAVECLREAMGLRNG